MSELEIKLFHRRLVEILCLQLTVMVGSYVVSHFLAFKNREFLQQNIKAAQERYKNVEKTKFIANMSHEARNPLHCIMGSLQVMEHHFDGEEYSAKHCCKHCFLSNGAIQESIEDIKENATLLLHILSSSLQMSSLEMGKIQLKHEPFNLKVLLDSLIGVFSQLAHEKNISLHLFYDVSRVPQLFQGDSVRLSQIIMNIISNAIKYTKKGYVRVNCMLAKDDKHEDFTKLRKNRVENSSACQVLLEFIDTGCGISQDQIHKLFQPYGVLEHQNEEFENSSFEQYFHQSENLRKLNDGGSTLIYTHRNGLGLSITKLLIHKMKGHIKVVSSQVGVGTKMTISLPLETCDNSNIEKSIGGFLLSDNSMAYHVTIIDDDECFREVLKDYLSLMKRVKSIACYESVSESMQNQVKSCDDSYSDRKSLSLIIVPEREYEKATNCFGKNEQSKIISTIFKGEKRNFQHALYLPKPIKFSELVELFNTMMTSEENSDNESVDMEVNRKVLVKMLQIIGFKDIDTSNDGMQCFEKFKEKSYHLVLLDCFMPILSGKEACEMIRNWVKYRHHQKEELPRIPIIAITANTWEPKETLLSQGFDDVVYKPFVLEDFRSLLRSYLGKVNNIH
ncbi:hypothetical protein C9374_005221 [Naegleria lovaniensis]|uniref:Histidine kinase n=1 Tax=Naegleria lovaniensis TaxID=51637 RepID=A0AA88KNJ6_NAELO|nr:uncharacterized protein C9374_005221 [Naegleria lovaniensis]KAG2382641.1 hypothetical protein C9374_005221 [Naegleria lovaniensis]